MENKPALSGGYLWRAIISIVIGLVMVIFYRHMGNYLVMAVGVALILIGVIVTTAYFIRAPRREEQKRLGMAFPITGLLYLIGGILLVAMPDFFLKVFVIVMGIVLILAAIDQLWMLVRFARKGVRISTGLYVLSALILIAGIIMVASPAEWLNAMFILFGIMAIVYGLSDLADQYLIRKAN